MLNKSFRVLFYCALWFSARTQAEGFYPDHLKLAGALYLEQPDISQCKSGKLLASEKQTVLLSLNAIRKLHGLAPVLYAEYADDSSMQTALLMAANARISHQPTLDWRCYSKLGAEGAMRSIISGGLSAPNIAFLSPEQDLIEWLTDRHARSKNNIGHRRWLLDPFLKKIAYGRVSGRIGARRISVASALDVQPELNWKIAGLAPEIIAYPFHDYPARLFSADAPLSISLFIDNQIKTGNRDVDFSQAKLQVRDASGKNLSVKNIAFDNDYFGLPNNFQFNLPSFEHNKRYTVLLENVRVRGKLQSIQYWFRITSE